MSASGEVPEIYEWFEYSHLPEKAQRISAQFRDLVDEMLHLTATSAEQSAGLRKLLEAKDCFVRAGLKKKD